MSSRGQRSVDSELVNFLHTDLQNYYKEPKINRVTKLLYFIQCHNNVKINLRLNDKIYNHFA